MSIITIKNLWEKYRIKFIRDGKVSWEENWALEDVNLQVGRGEVLGVIGQNGAGKTTLLKLIAGMLIPDRGEVRVDGKVSVLMELGAGFNPELTGRENILYNAKIYGLNEETAAERMQDIIAFAGLGKFIEAPIKYYSQGMFARLAFSLAIFVQPDVLLIDDILSVGDEDAQQKCIAKVWELRQAGKTIILVSHDMNMVKKLCDRAVLLEKGRMIQEGPPAKAISYYLESVGDKKGIAVLEKDSFRAVFNNGRLFLSYRGIPFTQGTGGCVAFFLPALKVWSSSVNLLWEITSSAGDKITAEGRLPEGTVAQSWDLRLEKDCLRWRVEVKEKNVEEPHIDLLLVSQYKRWDTVSDGNEFPAFGSKSEWQDLAPNGNQGGILAVSPDGQSLDMPRIILEQEESGLPFKIFNTGYAQEARVLQYVLDVKNSLAIKIFPERNEFEEYFGKERQRFLEREEEKRKQLLLEQEAERRRLLLERESEAARLRALRTIYAGDVRLFADVENKALRLYSKDREITKNNGLSMFCLLENKWYDTSFARWQVRKEEDELIVRIEGDAPRLNAIWRFALKDDSLFLRAEFDCADFFHLLKFGLFLTSEYKRFFCSGQEGNFPMQFNDWQDMSVQDSAAEQIGLREEGGLPALFFENKQGLTCVIQNSNSELSCRSLQWRFPVEKINSGKGVFSARIGFCADKGAVEEYLKAQRQKTLEREETERQRLLLKQESEAARLRALRTIYAGDVRLFADVENKALRLYFKDREISRGRGLSSLFGITGQKIHLRDAQWQIEKITEQTLRLTARYASFLLAQIWTLTFTDRAELEVRIEMELAQPIGVTGYYVNLELQDGYKNWLTENEAGDTLAFHYIDGLAPVRVKENKVQEIMLRADEGSAFPQLFFGVCPQERQHIMSIYKQKNNDAASLCLNFSPLISRKENMLAAGRHICFQGKIALDRDMPWTEKKLESGDIVLRQEQLKLYFDHGRGRIFWAEKELTAGLSAYTSLRCSGIWYDSYHAVWRIKKQENNKIIVAGDWCYIPLSQEWQIEIVNKTALFWQVRMRVEEELSAEIIQTNLMLSPRYKDWGMPGYNSGRFSDEYTEDYDILPFRFCYGKAKEISVAGQDLPRIVFNSETREDNLRAIVENTDNLYQARLLQYQRENKRSLLPGEYLYFKGTVRIGNKE